MTKTEIRDALTAVHDAVQVPPVDEVAFQARVRQARRRRTAGRGALLAGTAAAAAVAVAVVMPRVVGEGTDGSLPADRGVQAASPLEATQWFVLDHRLSALDPSGTVHRLDIEVESVTGWDPEHVYATSTDGLVVVVEHWLDDAGTLEYQREQPPTSAATHAVRSDDGRYVAWVDGRDIVVRDNDDGRSEELRLPVDENTALVDVGAEGVLVSEGGDLVLRDGERSVDLPTALDGYGVASQLAPGRVLVPDRDGRSRLYDVSGTEARLLATVTGLGRLAADGERIAIVHDARITLWRDGDTQPLAGLVGEVDDARWAPAGGGSETLLVTTHGAGAGLFACDPGELTCTRLPVEGEVGLQ